MDLSKSENIVAALKPYLSVNRQQVIEKALKMRTRHLVVGVENLYQTQNASAILRTSDAFGIQEMHAIEDTLKLRVNAGISRGSEKWIDIKRYHGPGGMSECLGHLRRRGYRIYVTSPHIASLPPDEADVSQPMAVFLGNEKYGVSPPLMQQADGFLRIPMTGFAESLNVSVANGILLYVLKNKMKAEGRWTGLSEEEMTDLRAQWYRKAVRHADEILDRLQHNP
jgi:tRNA (guanosine-2'-O-)-methyltransferase